MNVNKETTIRITLDKDRRLEVNAQGTVLPEAIQLCLAAIEAMCKQTLSRTDDKELIKSLREDMYEMINIGASSLLNKLFPDIDMRPDITVDAIKEAEDALLAKQGETYTKAYAETAQKDKDQYEHALAGANVNAPIPQNREQRRQASKSKGV